MTMKLEMNRTREASGRLNVQDLVTGSEEGRGFRLGQQGGLEGKCKDRQIWGGGSPLDGSLPPTPLQLRHCFQ